MFASSKVQEIYTFSAVVTKRSVILKHTNRGPRTQFSPQGSSRSAHVPKNAFYRTTAKGTKI